jgi:WhiB family transcriptional regulator, redox-sensing transcriptional regulator
MGELATMLTRWRQPATRDWRMAAACRHTDPDLFFPVSSNGQSLEQTTQAKALCCGCSVRPACLQFALDTRADGVWGGMTEEERRRAMPLAPQVDKIQHACLLHDNSSSAIDSQAATS